MGNNCLWNVLALHFVVKRFLVIQSHNDFVHEVIVSWCGGDGVEYAPFGNVTNPSKIQLKAPNLKTISWKPSCG